jgi:hypothetical protein
LFEVRLRREVVTKERICDFKIFVKFFCHSAKIVRSQVLPGFPGDPGLFFGLWGGIFF